MVVDRKQYMKKWRQSKKGKESNRKSSKKYQQMHPEIRRIARKKYYYLHRERIIMQQKVYHQSDKYKIYQKKYAQSEHGKVARKKYRQSKKGKLTNQKTVRKAKAKRKRNLGFDILFENPFNKCEIIHWHHINNCDVVAIPKDLHYQYMGKYHRENTMEIVKQIYGGEIYEKLSEKSDIMD